MENLNTKTAYIDEGFYSRQLYVIGETAMNQLAKASVLICGMRGLGIEIAKNIILCGIKSVILQDSHKVEFADLASQYYFTEADIGENRAKTAHSKLSELNNDVHVTYTSEALTESFIQLCNIEVVVLTDVMYDEQVVIGNFCHQHGIKLVMANTRGLFGQIFCDFGENFQTIDIDGEKPQEQPVNNISHDKEGVVSACYDVRHRLDDGSYVTFTGVKGMHEVNEKEFQIHVLNPYQFSIGDTTKFNPYDCGGKFKEVKKPKFINFKPFGEAWIKPELPMCDFSKMAMPINLHLAFRALSKFKNRYHGEPKPWDDIDAEKFFELFCEFDSTEELNTDWIKLFSKTCTGDLCPIQSIIGGLSAQEVIKGITRKFMPFNQFFYFDAIECLPNNRCSISDVNPTSRYYSQEIIFGRDFQYKLGKLNLFLAGIGASGCELLKNFSMMGIGCETEGSIQIADMDSIEKSNLHRHFLFRSSNIGEKKSHVATEMVKKLNPTINVRAFIEPVDSKTEYLYNANFFEQLDIIVGAIDNKAARKYLDQRCVYHRKPWIDCGTLGTKANVQIILPFLTESYSSTEDPPEPMIPIDKIVNFPNTTEEVILWARDKFHTTFIELPKEAIEYMLNPNSFIDKTEQSVDNIRYMLGKDHPKTFMDCIVWARNKFEELFLNNIAKLLFHFPRDFITSTGERFWSRHLRCPHVIQFDSTNPLHIDFIVAASNLLAHVYTIPHLNNRHEIIQQVEQVQVPKFDYKPIQVDDTNTNDSTREKNLAVLPKQEEYQHIKIQPHDLKLDDDSNFQLDYLLAMANLRAENYEIDIAERYEVKRIAGNVLPAIVTTSAIVSGLVSLEIYKLVQEHTNMEYFKNAFINTALSLLILCEPTPVKKQKYLDHEFTLWDRFELQGDMTLEEFIDYFKREHKLCPACITSQQYLIYASFLLQKKKRIDHLKLKISEVYEQISGIAIPEHVRFLVFEMACEDMDGNDIDDVPCVNYKFR